MKKLFLFAFIPIISLIFANCKSTTTDSTTRYQVSLTALPSEGGVVSPANGQHDEGTSIDITATSNEGWVFIRWEGDYSGTSSAATITVDGDKNIAAIFEESTYALTVNITGEGTVDEQIVANKTTDYESGTVVELTATPAEGWKFVEWQGAITGTANPQQITMDEPKEVTALFEKKSYALTVNITGEGAVEEQIVASKTTDYESGTVVELTATPAQGWEFVEWQGALTGTANPQQVTIDEPKEVTAVFEQTGFALDIAVNGEGTVTKSPDQSVYDSGSLVELTATPATGWKFSEWGGDLTGSANPQEITMDGAKQVTAVFTEQTPSSLFYLDTNGVTVKCEDANVGDSGEVNGVMYTKRIASEITPANAETTCTSEITSMISIFEDASAFDGDISSWDVGYVTSMSKMFTNDTSFTGNLSNWDVSNVNDMSSMFENAYRFNGDISGWDVSGVTNMSGMFSGTRTFDRDLSSWDVSSVTDMSFMFSNANPIDSMGPPSGPPPTTNWNISSWNVGNVTDMSHMFDEASLFNDNINSWDVSNVMNMSAMFKDARSFTRDLNSWNVGSVTDMSNMFWDATNFNGDISTWDVSSVTRVHQMFFNASSFNGDLSSWDVSSVTDMRGMLMDAVSFSGDISGWDVSSVTNIRAMFSDAESFNGDISSWDVSNVIDMRLMFSDAISFNGDISSWDVGKVTDMRWMFDGASSFNQDIGGWDVSNVTLMLEMFENASIFNQDLSGWCVTNITSEPGNFSTGSPLQESFKPVWGTCPAP